MAILTTGDDSVVKQKIELNNKPILIGRHPECDVIIDDGSVSRHHAQIMNDKGGYFVQDMNSRNGTYVNDESIAEPTKLYDGSTIKICDVEFTFFLSDFSNPAAKRPRATIETPSQAGESPQSIIMEDDEKSLSQVMSKLEVPSHYTRSDGNVSAEDKLQALIKITQALSESVLMDEILNNCLACLFDLFKEADRGFIVLKTPDGNLRPLAMKTRRPKDEELIRISRTIAREVMDTKQPLISTDAAMDSRFDMSQSVADFRIRSMMCAPLINTKDESLGVIQLDTLKKSIAFSEEDLELLVTVAMQASVAIQKADLFQDVKKAESIRADLKLAHEMQMRFLPQRNPLIDDYDFFAFYKPMQQVGGDYYDYVKLDEHRTAIIVADVVGHGITAAMMMAKVSAESRFALATSKSPLDAIAKMNSNLSSMNVDRFVTLVLAVLDTRDNSLVVVNAGHMPPIVRSADSGEFRLIAAEESGLPLGVLENAEYQTVDIKLNAGDTVVMYTDGINESMNEDGEQLTVQRMVSELRESQTKSPDAIGSLLCQVVNRHVGMQPSIDDMCLVCVGRNEHK